MDQLELLWQYQLADMDADKLEKEIRRSPNRVKLVKSRDFLMEQQEIIKSIETEVAEMTDRVDMIEQAVSRAEEQLNALEKKLNEVPPQDLEATRAFLDDARHLMDTINDYESETKKIKKDANSRDQQQHDVRVKAAKVKSEFDQLKKVYDVEYKEQMAELDKKRAIAAKKTEGIEPEYLEKYKAIKQHSVPPMAKLLNDQCGGCNMSLPSVTLRAIKSGNTIVECETCGRMIIQ